MMFMMIVLILNPLVTGITRSAFWRKIRLDQELIDQMILQDSESNNSRILCEDGLKARLLHIIHMEGLDKRLPLWQMRYIELDYCEQVALLFRCHQSVCDGMGLMSLLLTQLADQTPASTTTFIRTCNGTMTATNCEYCYMLE